MNPFGAQLKAIFTLDIGHWDVTKMTRVLEEAYELVEKELLHEDEFRDFVFVNPTMLHAAMNPAFFKGTSIEVDVSCLLAEKRSAK